MLKEFKSGFGGCFGVFAAIIILIIIFSVIGNNKVTSPNNIIKNTYKDEITLAEFNEVDIGMTYNEVKGILGKHGELSNETSISGYTSKMYTWSNGAFGGSVTILFSNEEVSSKSQFLLK